MTHDEFRTKFLDLMMEFDPNHKMDFLLTVILFDTESQPDDVLMIGFGCAACITEVLKEQVEDGTLKHHTVHKIH